MSVTPLIFNKNKLQFIADNNGQPYKPNSHITFLDGTTTKKIPDITNGTLYFATKDNENTIKMMVGEQEVDLGLHRAYIFLDDNDKRYAVTGPVDWTEILNKPLNQILSDLSMAPPSVDLHNLQLHYLNDITSSAKSVTLPFVLLSGDTMTGPLGIAASATDEAPKVQLSYNATTESLDFTFT